MKKYVIITGCSSGIGQATVQAFIQKKWHVIGIARHASGYKHKLFTSIDVDLSHLESVSEVTRVIAQKGVTIDMVIHCAGKGGATPLSAITFQQYSAVFDLNLRAVIFLTAALIPFIKTESGIIAIISSIAGIRGFADWSLYCASKHAVEGFASSLRYELRSKKIRVTVIQPGSVDTAFYAALAQSEKNDFMQPETIADLLANLPDMERHATIENVFLNNAVGDL